MPVTSAATCSAERVQELLREREVRSILVSRLRFMGDVILTTPLLRALKKALPDARLSYLLEQAYAPLLDHNPYVDEVITVPTRGERGSFRAQLAAYARVARLGFDVAIDLFCNTRSALLTRTTNAPVRIGSDVRGRRRLYTCRLPKTDERLSAVRHHLRSLELLGAPDDGDRTEVFVTSEEKDRARKLLKGMGLPTGDARLLVVVHAGATWPAKRWAEERFSELVSWLGTDGVADPILTTGPGEEAITSAVADRAKAPVHVIKPLGLRDLAGLLSVVDVVVSNDCGPMHLAVAAGTPTVGVFGPGIPSAWFPYRREDGHFFLHNPPSCHPCHKDHCDDLKCMDAIEVAEVIDRVQAAGSVARTRAEAGG